MSHWVPLALGRRDDVENSGDEDFLITQGMLILPAHIELGGISFL